MVLNDYSSSPGLQEGLDTTGRRLAETRLAGELSNSGNSGDRATTTHGSDSGLPASKKTDVLLLTKNELLDKSVYFDQAENGTIFYRNLFKSFWVNSGKQVKILGGFWGTTMLTAREDSVYYSCTSKKKIYRAVFKPPNIVETFCVRDFLKNEQVHVGGFCSRERDGRLFIYRMGDDPEKDGIQISFSQEELMFLELMGIHGNTFVFGKMSMEPIAPSLNKMGSNAIMFEYYRGEPPSFHEIRASLEPKDSSLIDKMADKDPYASPAAVNPSYMYITNGRTLFTIDPVSMKILPPSNFQNVTDFYIGGVREGQLIGRGKCSIDKKYHMMSVQLPHDYIVRRMDLDTLQSNGFSSKFLQDFTDKKIRGSGGQGSVYEVLNTIDGCRYAVKIIEVQENVMHEALAEVRALARLEHHGIVRYYGSWIEQLPRNLQISNKAYLYIQMQLCDFSLSEWLKNEFNQNPVSRNITQMTAWFKQIVYAVLYIHQMNLIHRDLKPGNILFAKDGVLKLCDLGIATARIEDDETRTTITRTGLGTEMYMSPEQLSRKRYGSKTDVFSLGLILIELCVVMTSDEKELIFNNHRGGVQSGRIKDTRIADFVQFLTQVNQDIRPTCQQIIEHDFFS